MKVAAIKVLVDTYTIEELKQADDALCNDRPLPIQVQGADAGEKLSHILAAIIILEDMAKGKDYLTSLRNYYSRVRNSIN